MKMIEPREVSHKMDRDEMIRSFGKTLEFDKSLKEFSTYKTGGRAKYFINITDELSLSETVIKVNEVNLKYDIIGGGSNLLIADSGYDGLIIKIDIKGIELISETEISCCAGEEFMTLIEFAADNSLTGLEFAAGIAGTVGGAVAGNAGAYGGEIKDILTEITVVDTQGAINKISPEQCQFEYRSSYFNNSDDIITAIKVKLKIGDSTTIKDKIEEILSVRRSKHPVDGKTAGSFFKNIIDPNEKYGKIPAGRLLEEAGVKGLTVGGAAVYEKHANMILNKNNATSKDIRDLADILKQRVFDKFGITLEEEVVSLGEF